MTDDPYRKLVESFRIPWAERIGRHAFVIVLSLLCMSLMVGFHFQGRANEDLKRAIVHERQKYEDLQAGFQNASHVWNKRFREQEASCTTPPQNLANGTVLCPVGAVMIVDHDLTLDSTGVHGDWRCILK